MRTMRAFVIPHEGHDSVEEARVPVPEIRPDELLVRIKAVGVGIHDSYFLPSDISYPYPIGIEAAGVLEEVGTDVAGHQEGDRVAFISSMQVKGGTWAEYAAVRSDSLIVPVPAGLDLARAAAVPVAGSTTLRAFHELPPIPTGGSVFVAGGSGAIGTFVVQLARARGWEVAASSSPHNFDYLVSLGASMTVDYHDRDWPEAIRQWRPGGVDSAIAVQPQTTADSLGVVKDAGTVVTISGDQVESERGVRVVMPPHQRDVRDELATLLEQITTGQVQLVTEVYPFEDALTALAKVQTRHARGKLVLSLD